MASRGLNVGLVGERDDIISLIKMMMDGFLTPNTDARRHRPEAVDRQAGRQAGKSLYRTEPSLPSSHHRWSAALARPCQALPPPAPLPERNSSSSSCCRFPLTTSHCPLPLPSSSEGRRLLDTAGYLGSSGPAHPHQGISACKSTGNTFPTTQQLLNFPAELGPPAPSCPSLLPLELGPGPGPGTWTCPGAGRDPQRADLGHSHPRIKKAAPALPRIILQS